MSIFTYKILLSFLIFLKHSQMVIYSTLLSISALLFFKSSKICNIIEQTSLNNLLSSFLLLRINADPSHEWLLCVQTLQTPIRCIRERVSSRYTATARTPLLSSRAGTRHLWKLQPDFDSRMEKEHDLQALLRGRCVYNKVLALRRTDDWPGERKLALFYHISLKGTSFTERSSTCPYLTHPYFAHA